MIDTMPARVRLFRIGVLALAIVYSVDRATFESWALHDFGWQFRYLTIWALTLSLISAALMLTPAFGRPDTRGAGFVAMTSTVNLIVVISYWRLHAIDPALVTGGREIAVWREGYLHGVGPALQVCDMLCLKRAGRACRGACFGLLAVCLAYVGWAEWLVAPLNDRPVGTVTTGLPYPFLNDMAAPARARFYAATFGLGLACILGLWLAQIGLDRLRGLQAPRSAARTAARPSR